MPFGSGGSAWAAGAAARPAPTSASASAVRTRVMCPRPFRVSPRRRAYSPPAHGAREGVSRLQAGDAGTGVAIVLGGEDARAGDRRRLVSAVRRVAERELTEAT